MNACLKHEDFSGTVIAIDVGAVGKYLPASAIHVASDNRTSAIDGMVIFGNRGNKVGRRTRCGPVSGAAVTFQNAPAVVAAGCNDIDFLAFILAHIAGVKQSRRTIERKPERIPHPERVDLYPS